MCNGEVWNWAFAGILTEGGAGGRPKCSIPGERGDQETVSLALPDLEQAKSAVLNTLTSRSGQRTYDHAINQLVDWYCPEPRSAFNRTVVLRYRSYLEERRPCSHNDQPPLGRGHALAYEAFDSGLLSPELASGIARIKGVRSHGVRTGNWLSLSQAQALLNAPDIRTRKGQRDRAR